jgi:hypothetical protein
MALQTLRLIIFFLAMFGVTLLAGLILARVVRDRLIHHRNRQREAISKALLDVALHHDLRALEPHKGKELLVAETAQSVADLVRGPELERMKTALAAHGLGPKLIRRLERGRKRQRMVAAEALALIPGETTVAALNAAREDRSPEVRLAAMFSLLDLEEAPSIRDILQTVGSGDWSRSLLVTELLRRLGRDQQAQLAEEIERPDLDPPVQVMLLEAVGGAGDFEVLPTVVAQADDDDPSVRAAAVRAMAFPSQRPARDRPRPGRRRRPGASRSGCGGASGGSARTGAGAGPSVG